MDTGTVEIPREVVERALRRARAEFVRLAVLTGEDAGDGLDTWPEFERLAEYLDEPGGRVMVRGHFFPGRADSSSQWRFQRFFPTTAAQSSQWRFQRFFPTTAAQSTQSTSRKILD